MENRLAGEVEVVGRKLRLSINEMLGLQAALGIGDEQLFGWIVADRSLSELRMLFRFALQMGGREATEAEAGNFMTDLIALRGTAAVQSVRAELIRWTMPEPEGEGERGKGPGESERSPSPGS